MAGDKRINGLDVGRLEESMEGMRDNPGLGRYVFRVRNEWVEGAHCRSRVDEFVAAGEEDRSRKVTHVLEGDEPESLLGQDNGPNATEALLHALGACLNASFIYHAAARGVKVEELEFDLEGDIDLNGFLGVDEDVPSNFQRIRVNCRVKADAPRETLEELLEYAQRRSPVFNSVTRPIPVDVSLEAAEAVSGARRR